MKSKIRNYNDGFIKVYEETPIKTDFGAKTNIKSRDNLKFIVKLAYQECSKREQDLQFAENNGRSLTIKVKTRLYKGLTSENKMVLNNVLYDIIYIDEDRVNKEMYFYCEKVRVIDNE